MSDALPDKLAALLKTHAEDAADLEIPPRVFEDMEGAFVDYREGEALRVRFPVRARYRNPLGMMQGGMIVAAADNALGPLSYLVAPPSVTTQLNTTYIRPVRPGDDYIDVEARVVEQAGRQLLMTAHVYNPAGEVVAVCHATCAILPRRRGART